MEILEKYLAGAAFMTEEKLEAMLQQVLIKSRHMAALLFYLEEIRNTDNPWIPYCGFLKIFKDQVSAPLLKNGRNIYIYRRNVSLYYRKRRYDSFMQKKPEMISSSQGD